MSVSLYYNNTVSVLFRYQLSSSEPTVFKLECIKQKAHLLVKQYDQN